MEYSIHASAMQNYTTVDKRDIMAPISSANRQQIYATAAQQVSNSFGQAFGQNSDAAKLTGKLPSIINGTYDPTSEVLDAMPIKDPTAKLVVGSALDILKTWLMHGKGEDKADATKATQKGNQASQAMQNQSNQVQNDTNALIDQTRSEADNVNSEVENTGKTVDDMEEENQTLQEEINNNNKEIEDLNKQNQEIDNEIAQLASELNIQPQTAPPTDNGGGTNPAPSGDGTTPQPDGSENPAPASNDGGTYQSVEADSMPGVDQAKLARYNELIGLRANNTTQIATFTETNTTHQTTITNNQTSIQESYQNIDTAADGIMTMIDTAQGAADNLKNVLNGNQKMFSTEQMINAGTQMAKSAINGTEGGVLAAFATAAGVSSIFSFGATAMQAEQAAEASADKFSSVPARIASQLAIKMSEKIASQAVNNALSQMSALTGVNFSEMYSTVMQTYQTASAGNEMASINTTPKSGGSEPATQKPANNTAPPEKKEDKPAVA